MAMQFASGSVQLYGKFIGGSVFHIGTCEQMPQDSRSPAYEMLMNDISGSQVPLDMAFEGESAQIGMTLTWWDENAVNLMTAAPNNTTPGSYSYSDVGTLMSIEEQTTELWLAYTFSSPNLAPKAVYTSNGLIPGRHYVQAVLYSPQVDEVGTRPMKRHLMYFAWPKLNKTTKRFTLWDQEGFASLPNPFN